MYSGLCTEGLQLKNYGNASEQSRIFTDKKLQKYVAVLVENYNPDEPEMTWLPLIMLYSGMRCNEVAQLYLDDIQEDQGISFFRIVKNLERGQRIKCKASARTLPIHPKLQELGFLEYVERMRTAGEAQLFPNCKYQKTGYYYSDAMSTRLNAAINLHISDDRKLRLYSLRANFRTAIFDRITTDNVDAILAGGSAENGILEQVLDGIMGHSIKGGTGKTTYTKVTVPLRAKVMTLLEYPCDFSQLQTLLRQ